MKKTTALVVIADGSEEMEAVIAIDVLRRAGWEVVVASLEGGPIVASRNVRILPDAAFADVGGEDYDVIVLPGGQGGMERFCASEPLLALLRRQAEAGRHLAAVCAAPLALQAAGVLEGRCATCYPSLADQLVAAERREAAVVVDRRLITSRGPGTSMDFALAIVAELGGEALAVRVGEGLLHPYDKTGILRESA